MRQWVLLFVCAVVAGLIPACGRVNEPLPEVAPTLEVFSQWAIAAEASSAFGFPDWSVNRATGAPEVDTCTDDSRAWASARGNGVEWLRLTYAEPVYATEVRVYQTWGRGAVSRVSLINEDGISEVIWEGMDAAEPCPGVFVVQVPRTPYRVVGVRVELDESRTGFWNEIDAVELIGLR